MEQQIRFCTTSDGVTIAYSVIGEGPPLLWTPGWISHLELDMTNPAFVAFTQRVLAGGRQLIRYDSRGTGLSDREVADLSVEARARDIRAVVEHIGLASVLLAGWSVSGPPAIVYAAENPEKVPQLILYGTFARSFGQNRQEVCRALLALMRAEWGIGSKTVVDFVHPSADRPLAETIAGFFRLAAPMQVATDILEEGMFAVDVTQHLPRLTMPTLVMHRREDTAVPFEYGRQLAALVPNSRLLPLPGNVHPPFYGDDDLILDAIDEFLGRAPSAAPRQAPPSGLQTILFTDMEGSTPLTQRLGDAAAQELVRLHNAIVREAVRSHGGTEIKHTGDGLMASFPSASRAIESAIAIQRACHEQAGEHPGAPLRLRIGLNAGEPVAEEQDLYGTAVQLAARVCGHAEPGQIVVSDVVRQLAAGKGFLFSDRGEVALRGFEDPVRLHEVRWES